VSSDLNDDTADWLGDLFHRHATAILAYAWRRLESREDAEDVVTEVFTIAWRRRADVPSDALPWLYATAANVVAHSARSLARRRNLVNRLALVRPETGSDDPASQVANAIDAHDVVVGALLEMSDDDAEILRLWAWEQLSPTEIAAVLACTSGTARTRLHRARTRLRAALHERGVGELAAPVEDAHTSLPTLAADTSRAGAAVHRDPSANAAAPTTAQGDTPHQTPDSHPSHAQPATRPEDLS